MGGQAHSHRKLGRRRRAQLRLRALLGPPSAAQPARAPPGRAPDPHHRRPPRAFGPSAHRALAPILPPPPVFLGYDARKRTMPPRADFFLAVNYPWLAYGADFGRSPWG